MNELTNKIMLENLENVIRDVCSDTSSAQTSPSPNSRQISSRNWAFDFYLRPKLLEYAKWLEYSDEESNYTYSLANLHHLAGWADGVTGCGLETAEKYIFEILDDTELASLVMKAEVGPQSKERYQKFGASLFGRRIGWYAIARILKPRFIVETGVDRGLGTVILCRALQRNDSEGDKGIYLGTDINPAAGYLLSGPLVEYGHIAYGDSIETLKKLTQPIDLFINDSDHSAEYEGREYQTITPLLHDKSIVLGDNSHATNEIFQFARHLNWSFLHYAELPKGHWYPGAGIGAAFRRI
jgi:hypothetical protein